MDMMKKKTYVVEYCYSWYVIKITCQCCIISFFLKKKQTNKQLTKQTSNRDGGDQESGTAARAIQAAAGKDAKIEFVASDSYPIMVTIKTNDGKVLWKNSQKKLYKKYAQDRANSIKEIEEAVRSDLVGE